MTAKINFTIIGLALIGITPMRILAQGVHSHADTPQQVTREQKTKASELIEIVRNATERFKNVSAAEAEGYVLQFGCVTGSDSGAMGLHYVNGDLVKKGELDPNRPHIVIYEPNPDGSLKLTGADFLLFADAWNAKHSSPPQLMGQLFHLFEAPNRFGLPAFYTLHVWAWKDNPNGAFVNWHPNVNCDSFVDKAQ
jgi:hypothetical protein